MNPTAKRTISGLATAALAACAILWIPASWLLFPLAALVALVHLEFVQMAAKKHEFPALASVALGAAFLATAVWSPERETVAFAAVFAALAAIVLFGKWKSPAAALGIAVLGIVYVPFMLSRFVFILRDFGPVWLLYAVAMVKVSDMGGFAFGIAFGRHKMCPSVSPAKSWEGFGGSVFGACLVSCLFIPFTKFAFSAALAYGVFAAVAGTFGDLVESRFKRECGVKDSATFMPAGMGGFLDMFDSLVVAPAAIYWALSWTGAAA